MTCQLLHQWHQSRQEQVLGSAIRKQEKVTEVVCGLRETGTLLLHWDKMSNCLLCLFLNPVLEIEMLNTTAVHETNHNLF